MSGIVLSAAQRATLQSLQSVTELQSQTQTRLNTGKKVNSAADDAVSFFKAQGLDNRATQFLGYKSQIDQSVQTINAALNATDTVQTILQQLQGVLANVSGGTAGQNRAATQQFKDLTKQLYQLVSDSTYQGVNILNSTLNTLSTQVSTRTASTFVINGYNLQASNSSRALFTQASAVFGTNGALNFSNLVTGNGSGETTISSFTQLGSGTSLSATQVQDIVSNTQLILQNAVNQIQGITAALGTNVSILQDRSNFSQNYASTLQTGRDNLTLADLNVEAANSQALSLRQQLGIQSLTTLGTQNSAILTLLRS